MQQPHLALYNSVGGYSAGVYRAISGKSPGTLLSEIARALTRGRETKTRRACAFLNISRTVKKSDALAGPLMTERVLKEAAKHSPPRDWSTKMLPPDQDLHRAL